MDESLRYPIGRFALPSNVAVDERRLFLVQIAEAPRRLRDAVQGLGDERLDTPYRPGGWTVRQVVHHLADSHMTSYIRFKLAATEDRPQVKGYDEVLWAELADARRGPVGVSLTLLDALHERWVLFLDSLSEEEYRRTFLHSQLGAVRLDQNVALYAWHGRHHVAHITSLGEREGWT